MGLGWSSLAPPPRSTGTSLTSGKASAPLRSSLVSFFPALTRRPPRPQHSRCPIPAPPALTRRPPRPPPRARAPAPGRTPRPPHPPALALRTRAGSLTEPSQRKRADKSWPLRSIRAPLSQFQLSQPPALPHRAAHTQRDHGLPAFISPHVKTDTLLAPLARGAAASAAPRLSCVSTTVTCDLPTAHRPTNLHF